MATLQVTFKDLREEVQRYLGYGRETPYGGGSALTASNRGDVLVCIERGLRQFYNPAPLPNESSSHEWSFLRGEGVIATVAPHTDSTIDSISGTTVEGNSGTNFTSAMVGRLLHVNNEIREITAFTDADTITIDRALETAISADSTVSYEIIANKYSLPADFGGLKGNVTYRDGDGYTQLKFINESAIRMLRSQGTILTEVPEYFSIVPTAVSNETTSAQAFELTIWPFPDKVYDLNFSYTVLPNSLGDDADSTGFDNNVPAGGMIHGETIMASCLTIAEQMVDEFNNPGKMQARYNDRLMASISYDRRNMLPDGFGYNGDNSDRRLEVPTRRRLQTVTYRDTLYP